ncbi:alpha-(1,3)-fucosyltransferase 10 [Panulirus ornatus]|uniref:alpha-(1,3)-fucosyltransferase 10 n=1 Tax=Panulirus ornatus TaxID=150431 RepID=UPI003A895B7A
MLFAIATYVMLIETVIVVKCNIDSLQCESSLQRGEGAGCSHGEVEGSSVVLWWTPFTGILGQSRTCDLGTCYFTEDRDFLRNHWTKAVLFYGSDFNVEDLPLPRGRHHWWGLLHEESPKNQPLFDHQFVLQLFNLTATFRRGSSFPLTLQHLESLEALTSRGEFIATHDKNRLMKNESLAPIVYVQSNCDTLSERDKFVEELSKYIKIDSYGACLHNRDLPSHLLDPAGTYDHKDFRSIIAKYKFTLAIENAGCDDYITEKLWRPLTVGSVPIYWGSPSVTDWEPNRNSLILIDNFQSPRDLALYIHRVIGNDTLYDSHLMHKIDQRISNSILLQSMHERKWGINNDFEKGNFIEHFECFVCNQILARHAGAKPGEVMASVEHYGCPEPPSVLEGGPNRRSFWVEQWHKARVEARVLHHLMLSARSFTSDDFHQQVLHHLHQDGFFHNFPPEHVEL